VLSEANRLPELVSVASSRVWQVEPLLVPSERACSISTGPWGPLPMAFRRPRAAQLEVCSLVSSFSTCRHQPASSFWGLSGAAGDRRSPGRRGNVHGGDRRATLGRSGIPAYPARPPATNQASAARRQARARRGMALAGFVGSLGPSLACIG
jgi:hypothetical protein